MTHDPNHTHGVDFEREDVNEGRTFWFGVGILVIMVVTAFATKPLYQLLVEREADAQGPADYVAEADPAALEPPAPRLQVQPEVDLVTLRSQEDAILTSYAWVDKEHGIARIPVEEAMRLVADKGLPTFSAPGVEGRPEEVTP